MPAKYVIGAVIPSTLHSMSATAAEWAFEEFGAAKLSDGRWTRRLVAMGAEAARQPAGKVSEVYRDPAMRQGAYGLLESPDISPDEVSRAMFSATARRAAREAEFVYCAVDGSSLTLVDRDRAKGFGPIGTRSQGRRGLKVMSALAVSAEGVPLGLTSQRWWVRSETRHPRHRDRRTPQQKETRHWMEAMAQTREALKTNAPGIRIWYQLDREGDAWPIIMPADADGHWFTIRASRNRRVVLSDGRISYLRDVLAQAPVTAQYALEVRPARNRTERLATMVIRACAVELQFRDKRTKQRFSKTVNVVWAREQDTTPPGEAPIEWLLLTNRPIETAEHVIQVVVGYSMRWRIEEFHRAWKSGVCRVEETQLRSTNAVTIWATILAAVAVRVERLKQLSREQPDLPATQEFSPVEIRAVAILRFGKGANQKLGTAPLTVAQVTTWIAEIGGYTGKSSGGPPGSITIARGLKDVRIVVKTLEATAQDL